MKKLIQSGDDEITRGDAVTLSMVAQLDSTPESIEDAEDITTIFMSPDGQRVSILFADHVIVEAAGIDIGAFEVNISSAVSALFMHGNRVRFCTTITDEDATGATRIRTYWGEITVKKKPGE